MTINNSKINANSKIYQIFAQMNEHDHNAFMVHPDGRKNINLHHKRFSDHWTEEVEKGRYAIKLPSNCKESKRLWPTFHNDVGEGREPNENQHFKYYNMVAKEIE